MVNDERFPMPPALSFLRTLWRLNHATEKLSQQMDATLGVTVQQRLLLRLVGRHPGITASRLAAELHLDRSTVSTTLARLEKKGHLVRQKDGRDGRRVVLGLTASGRALDTPDDATVEAAVEALLEKLGVREHKIFAETLSELAAQIERRLR